MLVGLVRAAIHEPCCCFRVMCELWIMMVTVIGVAALAAAADVNHHNGESLRLIGDDEESVNSS